MVMRTSNPSSSLTSQLGKRITHHAWKWKGSKASSTHSYVLPQLSQDPPAAHQDNYQGEESKEGEGSIFLQGNNPSMETRSTLAATTTVPEKQMSISEALLKTSKGETWPVPREHL